MPNLNGLGLRAARERSAGLSFKPEQAEAERAS